MKVYLAGSLVAVAVIVTFLLAMHFSEDAAGADITSFEECAAAGNPVTESRPRQCSTEGGEVFVENLEGSAGGSVGRCSSDSDCPVINCIRAPCDYNVCHDGECVKVEAEEPVRSENARRASPEIPTDKERESLPECAGLSYSEGPVEIGEIQSISPIGNVDPPAHTIPTNHPFIHVSQQGTTTELFDLISPADVWVTSIDASFGITQDPADYTIYFALCRDVMGYYNHVKELSPEMQEIVDGTPCAAGEGLGDESCFVESLDKIEAGSLMGSVGGHQGNFDFGAFDLRTEHAFANPERYAERTKHIECAFDYYEESRRIQLMSLVENSDGECGKVLYDIPGTLQGNWWFGDANEYTGGDWVNSMFFGYDNENPDLAVIAAGGVFTEPLRWKFEPEQSGTVNVEFDKVTADGGVYCYDARVDDPQGYINKEPTGKILVRVDADDSLSVELQVGACSSGGEFLDPYMYNR